MRNIEDTLHLMTQKIDKLDKRITFIEQILMKYAITGERELARYEE